MNERIIKRGEIYWIDLPKIEGSSIQSGVHPCLILQNDVGNKFSPNVQVCCVSSNIFKKDMPTHVKIKPDNINNLTKDSVILVETTTNIPQKIIGDYKGKVGNNIMKYVDKALDIQFGRSKPFDMNYIQKLVYEIKKLKELFLKYKEDFLKFSLKNRLGELENYCNEYNKSYIMYLNSNNIMPDEVLKYAV